MEMGEVEYEIQSLEEEAIGDFGRDGLNKLWDEYDDLITKENQATIELNRKWSDQGGATKGAFERYNRNLGEARARNVEDRMWREESGEERLPPWNTGDLPYKYQRTMRQFEQVGPDPDLDMYDPYYDGTRFPSVLGRSTPDPYWEPPSNPEPTPALTEAIRKMRSYLRRSK